MKGAMSTQATEQIVHPTAEELELGAVLHALSDPVRLQIVAELARREGEYTCGSFALPVTKSTCTHHFKVLREAGLIHQRPQGTTRLNRLRREDLEVRFPGLLATILKAAEAAGHTEAAEAARAAKAVGAAKGPVAAERELKASAARAVA
jgi:DNA-binding transcriptional ArsR family regulator